MRVLLLLALIAGLGAYIYTQRKANYPLQEIVTPAGRSFAVLPLRDDCQDQLCIKRLVYLTSLKDTLAIKEEARLLIPWIENRAPSSGQDAVSILALEPGFLRIAPPKAAHALAFVRLNANTEWIYAGLENRTAEITTLLRGK